MVSKRMGSAAGSGDEKALHRGRALECVMESVDQALASRSITQGRPCFLRLTKPGW